MNELPQLPKSGNGGGVSSMKQKYLIPFLLSVLAGVVANYISKWLYGG